MAADKQNLLLKYDCGQKVRKKVFNWSEVHLYQSNFLQNPYFNWKYIRPEPYKIHLVLRYMDARIQMHFQNEFDSILKE